MRTANEEVAPTSRWKSEGGGIRWASVKMLGADDRIRWALKGLGKTGGESSCRSVSVSDPSSSSEIAGGKITEGVDALSGSGVDIPVVNQLRR